MKKASIRIHIKGSQILIHTMGLVEYFGPILFICYFTIFQAYTDMVPSHTPKPKNSPSGWWFSILLKESTNVCLFTKVPRVLCLSLVHLKVCFTIGVQLEFFSVIFFMYQQPITWIATVTCSKSIIYPAGSTMEYLQLGLLPSFQTLKHIEYWPRSEVVAMRKSTQFLLVTVLIKFLVLITFLNHWGGSLFLY